MTIRMHDKTIDICETFTSIQGESTYAGLSCYFIRLAGCNLTCNYCDTPQSRLPGRPVLISELIRACRASGASIVEITGGEPLIQAGFRKLALALRDEIGKTVLIETNGSLNISRIPARVVAIMDIKTPGSGMSAAADMANLARLRHYDEVKFVITDRSDYEWSRRLVKKHRLASACHAVLFSPALKRLRPSKLGEWIVEDRLPVRLQIQMHKVAGIR